jgi:hypothetical protein
VNPEKPCSFVRPNLASEITKQVIRKKLVKQRHLVIEKAIDPAYLDSLFPQILQLFKPQTVYYNGGVAKVPEWKISCYLEVMNGGIPTTKPNLELCDLLKPLLEQCNLLFLHWYKQQHACNTKNLRRRQSPAEQQPCEKANSNSADSNHHQQPTDTITCHRLMTFITRYTPAPGEQALLKHVDGAGKVDGSIVLALPMETNKMFKGGGLTVWDGKDYATGKTLETHYETRNGDVAFIDR